ncbi:MULTISPECIES: segregation/condensation protein A [Pseudanabaena]|jgi:segregation and condensation protein A|uniref:segregation/condensation protein A n=1 Tax=Pseudanabaena TaxID=1152 RepID=UPI002478D713|nr:MULTISPECIES: segregation/condensation protein A [Pseudanabaena]MEA5485551.1 segregation/condensation protein A [Pseudanabaena sp. CCNP1317]WGS70688.1 segregation/condensation protein A [Pseudanabaena galeata CCNP1313]
MTLSIAESVTKDAIALLIDLAERGEIDPWDVQVIDVVDRFLSRLIVSDRRDLYDSGQAMLYASMLVLLKANSLSDMQSAYDQETTTDDDQGELDEEIATDSMRLPTDFDKRLRRLPVALPPKARRITLEELIAQIEAISEIVDRKTSKPTKRPSQSKVARKAAMKAIAQLAHKENLSEMVEEIERYFLLHPDEEIEISDLAAVFNDRVGVFWGLLLMSSQSKVELFQSEFYGKIQIVPTVKSPTIKELPFPNSSANSTVDSTQLQLKFAELKEVS